ncbi:Glycosyltransferase [hydrothermal vent metagenome]|uniref:Glycosyltransferase n=1 Tax=hydrothermal vent metagenome TaxID=652676 RepID=A0A1W1BBM7_9ZZZZ
MSKKIFFIANASSIHTVKWVDYFVHKGYTVYLATFSKENHTACKNTYFLGEKGMDRAGKNYHYLLSVSKLAKILKKVKPDSINAHYSYSMGFVALLAKQRAGIEARFSVVCHGSDVLYPPVPFIVDKINRYVLKHADKIFAVSDEVREKIESLEIESEKIFVGQYGIEIEKEETLKDIDIISNRAYSSHSRTEFLLDALSELNEQRLKIVFILPQIEDDHYALLVKKYPSFEFYKKMEHARMLELIARSKIYISATRSDGTALSLLEAMYLGAVPLLSNIPSNRSWIADGLNGYLFDTKELFISKMTYLLKMNERRYNEMQRLNCRLIEYRADYQTQMQKIETEVL